MLYVANLSTFLFSISPCAAECSSGWSSGGCEQENIMPPAQLCSFLLKLPFSSSWSPNLFVFNAQTLDLKSAQEEHCKR